MQFSTVYRGFDQSSIAFLVLEWFSPSGKQSELLVRYANEAAATRMGLPLDALVGSNLIPFFPASRSKWFEITHTVTYQTYPFTYRAFSEQVGKELYLDLFYTKEGCYGCFLSEDAQESALSFFDSATPQPVQTDNSLEERNVAILQQYLVPAETPDAEALMGSADMGALLLRCTKLIADSGKDLHGALQGLLGAIGAFFGARDAFATFAADINYQVLWSENDAEPLLPPVFYVQAAEPALRLWERQPDPSLHLFIPDGDEFARTNGLRSHRAAGGLRTLYAAPLLIDGKPCGLISLQNCTQHTDELWALCPIMTILGQVLEKMRRAAESLRLQTKDVLTSQLNFSGFAIEAEALLRAHPERKYAMLYCDIRRFKFINDIYGYATGDQLLHYWAYSIQRNCREGDIFCRVVADNFIILSQYEQQDEIADYFARIRQAVARFPQVTEKPFTIDLVCGIYLLGEQDVQEPDVSKMMDRANLAQKYAKEEAGEDLAFYTDELRDFQLREMEISQNLHSSLEAGEFYIVVQPQFDYATGLITGAEALVRWKHPKFGQISPGEFIPILERSNQVHILDQFVWEEVCRLIRKLLNQGFEHLLPPISVNISRLDIFHLELEQLFPALLEKYQLKPSQLALEITESAYIDSPEHLINTVSALRDFGFAVEMDDFGSGYSSLNSLKDVPVDVLKLDMRFLSSDGSSGRGGSILSSVIRMAHWMDLPVIAEGVETRQQADYLKSVGCTVMQGYLFSRPLEVSDFSNLLRTSQPGSITGIARESDGGMDIAEFLNTNGESSYLFNRCIGGACVLEYAGEVVEALLFNDQFPEVLGISYQEVSGRRAALHTLFPETQPLMNTLESAQREGNASFEFHSGERTILFHARYLESRNQRHMFFAMAEDITQERRLREELNEVSRGFRSVLDLIPGGLCRWNEKEGGTLDFISPSLLTMLGYSRRAFAERFENNFWQMVYDEDRCFVLQQHEGLTRQGDTGFFEYRIPMADGELRWVGGESRLAIDEDGARSFYVIITDLDQGEPGRRSLRWQTAQYHIMTNVQNNVLFDYSVVSDTMSLRVSRQEGESTERIIESYFANSDFDGVYEEDIPRFRAQFEALRKAPQKGSFEYRGLYFGDEPRWFRMRYASFGNARGEVYRIIGLLEDIEDEALLRELARQDSMTGLLNQEATRQLIAEYLQNVGIGTMFMVDVDDFKHVNDKLGRPYGDELLQKIAEILRGAFRESDIVGRISGDEFLIFLPGLCDEEMIACKAGAILRAIHSIEIEGFGAAAASIGIATVKNKTASSYSALLSQADRALHMAKSSGKNRYETFPEGEDAAEAEDALLPG